MAKKLISYDDEAEGLGLPEVVEQRLNATYGTKDEVAARPTQAQSDARYALKGELPTDVATSPQQLNFLITDNPDYVGQEGDVVFRYQTWRHFADLSANGLDQMTPRLNPSTRWTSETGHVRHGQGTTIRTAQSVDALDEQEDRTDVEIVARVRLAGTGSATTNPAVVLRGSGADGESANMLYFAAQSTRMTFGAYVNGSGSPIRQINFTSRGTDVWVWLRLRADGDQAKARSWIDGDPEPATWDIEETLTNPALLGPGWAGVFAGGADRSDYALIGLANSGSTAPKEPM